MASSRQAFNSARKLASRRFLFSLVLAIGVSALMLSFQGLNDRVFPADAALVLRGEVYENGQLSSPLKAQLDAAFGLYHYGTVKNIIVSGATTKHGLNEAEAMQNYLLRLGVKYEHIVLDASGENIKVSAHFVAGYMQERGWERLIAVNRFFYLPRVVLHLKHEGVPIVGSLSTRHFSGSDVFKVLREIPVYFSYWAEVK